MYLMTSYDFLYYCSFLSFPGDDRINIIIIHLSPFTPPRPPSFVRHFAISRRYLLFLCLRLIFWM